LVDLEVFDRRLAKLEEVIDHRVLRQHVERVPVARRRAPVADVHDGDRGQ
jgi:hypothetical protein